MRLVVVGDSHIRFKAPINRCDASFFDTQFAKWIRVFRIAQNVGAKFILQPGDLFDHPRAAEFVYSRYIQALKDNNLTVLSVMGQHDSYHHDYTGDTIERTAMGVMKSAGVVKILPNDPNEPLQIEDVKIWGAAFGQEPPDVPKASLNGRYTNILVAHASVGDKRLYPGHQLVSPPRFARANSGFHFMLLGDYHYPYEWESNGRRLANAGCMVRLTVHKRDTKRWPRCGVWDSKTNEIRWTDLGALPPEEVFKGSSIKRQAIPLEEFLQRLKQSGSIGVSFEDNLEAIMNERSTSRAVRSAVAEALEHTQAEE